jgi:AraC-like DNA-binding protein
MSAATCGAAREVNPDVASLIRATLATPMSYDVRFGDLSIFNREFRSRFGATPSDIRATRRN